MNQHIFILLVTLAWSAALIFVALVKMKTFCALNTRALGLYRHLGYQEDWREARFDPILKVELEKIGLSKKL